MRRDHRNAPLYLGFRCLRRCVSFPSNRRSFIAFGPSSSPPAARPTYVLMYQRVEPTIEHTLRPIIQAIMRSILYSLLAFNLLFSCAANALEPANPQANAKARAILNYLQGLNARTDKRLVTGQFTDAGSRTSLRLMDQIHDQTGQWPALMGADYADFNHGSLTFKAP